MNSSAAAPGFVVSYAGRDFFVAKEKDQVGFKGAITFEKRVLNALFAQQVLKAGSRVLDAYAGYGISTHDWLSSGASVLAVEQSKTNFDCLRRNHETSARLEMVRADNLRILRELAASGRQFDMIDLDPFGNAFEQVQLSLPLIAKGFFWLTSGELVNVRRKINRDVLTKRYGSAVDDFYERRKPVTEFPAVVEAKLKTLRSDLRLVNFVMSPGCLRMLFAVDASVPRAFLTAWSARPKLFGGLEKKLKKR